MATRHDDGTWEIQGRRIGFPVRIGSAAVACAAYLVPAGPARELVEGTGLELVTVARRTPVFLVLVDYRRSDLGDYDEVGLGLLTRYRGRIGPYIHQLPVTEAFTLEAGRALWGLPKWLARADLGIAGRTAGCRLATEDDRHVLTVALRTWPGRLPFTVPGWLTALAASEGAVLASGIRLRASGIRLGRRGAVQAGAGHPMADEVRALGLPGRRPLLTAVVDDVAFRMGPAEQLTGARRATSAGRRVGGRGRAR
jgi:hypothetical protein